MLLFLILCNENQQLTKNCKETKFKYICEKQKFQTDIKSEPINFNSTMNLGLIMILKLELIKFKL